ncbi:hypothetical protein GQX73_g8635 [Xylaria multiplex]|uniref:C2H2-type domain-containing protein n=1 Tax=Xylaria multiplex TaxID=323545 RepID=A0A7C8IVN5_9PEZI|nr:hypothetical protein GQX73_g8635 [Xylaria multiplex]
MDNHHLTLTSPCPADVHQLDHTLNMTFELPPHLVGRQGNMDFPHETQATGKDPMVRWYEVNDGPWHPQGLTSSTGDGGQSMVSNMRDNQFMVPARSNMVPSEIMPHSDSGYGSYQNQPSIANGSVCEDSFDTNQDTQSIIGGSIVDAQFSVPDAMSRNPVTLGGPKHDQRHKKPFKCDIKDCPRRLQGFSTTNDLDRHKRSVHPGSQTFGNRYVCQLGSCKSKEKIWPRADNFKAHLKRVHLRESVSDEDLEACIYIQPTSLDEPQDNSRQEEVMSAYNQCPGLTNGQPNNWYEIAPGMNSLALNGAESEETLTLSGPQQGLANLHIHPTAPHEDLYQRTTELDLMPSGTIVSSSPIQHNQLSHESEVSESASPTREQMIQAPRGHSIETQTTSVDPPRFEISDEAGELLSRSSPVHSLPDGSVKTDGGASESTEPEDPSTPETDVVKLHMNDPNEISRVLEYLRVRGVLEGHLEQLGYEKKGFEAARPTKLEAEPATNQQHCHPCSTCPKVFPRRCELKKHEKRHEKPYGCTLPDCDKRFGSKNDWKRHENTQHFMLEIWKCDEEGCEKLCHRREVFKAHLEKDHQIDDQNESEAKLEKCRVGRNHEARFWCGFCQKVIEIKQKGQQAWAERFDHIDEHFSGRNGARKEIGEWKNFDQTKRSKEDSDDGSDSGLSPRNAKAHHSAPEGIQYPPSQSKPKRKRVDGSNAGSSKKSRVQTRAFVCCNCKDLVTVSQAQCISCDHIPCVNCK